MHVSAVAYLVRSQQARVAPKHRDQSMADFMGMMKQAAELKSKMEAMGTELEQIEVEGAAGGGMVTVKLSGKGDMKSVKIDESLIKPSEKEIIEDLVVAAFADARRKVETLMQDKMRSVTGGLPLPPGLKLF
jgi:nucleoid-associated protein EbfC